MQRGFSTIEILIAMALAIMVIAAVMSVSFGNQSAAMGIDQRTEAASRAREISERMWLLGAKDFSAVTQTLSATSGPYTEQVSVELQEDYLTKLVTGIVRWSGEQGQSLSVEVPTLITDPKNAGTQNTCDPTPQGNWGEPQFETLRFGADIVGDSTRSFPLSSIDVYRKTLFATIDMADDAEGPIFFLIDVADPLAPVLQGSLDTNPGVRSGLSSIRVAGNYAFVANASGPNFDSCINTDGTNAGCSQLQIIDVSSKSAPSLLYSLKLSTSSAPFVRGSGGQGSGKSVYYKSGYVYLGLTKTASGPEFIVIDVRNPENPQYIGSFAVGHTVNDIYVRGSYAYLATTDNAREMIVLDVSDPSDPTLVSALDSPGATGFGYGKRVGIADERLFLARTYVGNAPELQVFEISDPASPMLLGSNDIGTTGDPQSINGIIARGFLNFLLLSDRVEIWDTEDPAAMSLLAQPIALPGEGTALDCEGDTIYIGSVPFDQKGYLSILQSGV